MKTKFYAIALVCNNQVISTDTQEQPVFIKEDLARFQALTTGSVCILGRKTFDSLNRTVLGNRKFVVISRKLNNPKIKDVTWVNSISKAISATKREREVWVIGGGQIYASFIDMCSEVYITRVFYDVHNPAARFPSLDAFEKINTSEVLTSNELDFVYEEYAK